MLPAATEPALRESWRFFVHLAVVLVPLFIGGSFMIGLAEEYLPPEAVERKLRGHDEGAGNVLAAGFVLDVTDDLQLCVVRPSADGPC